MDLIHPGTLPYKELRLDTAERKHIPNVQTDEILPSEVCQYRAFEKKYTQHPSVKYRSNVIPRYNCHGLTFAARRTGISESSVIDDILQDDKYVEVKPTEVLPGDIILYVDDTGDFEHSGVVITPPSEERLGVPLVYSKWGKGAELIHPGPQCPYNFANSRYYRVQF